MHSIGQHFIIGFEGNRVTPAIKKLIQKYHVGGLILFSQNIKSPRQVKRLVERLQSLSSERLFIGIDQEGGRVLRLKKPFTKIPSMKKVGEYYRRTRDVQAVAEVGRLLGRELRAVGINWNYAPVVDVHSNPKNPVIGDRSFSPDPVVVCKCAEALIRGLHSESVLSCAKHFPGHGNTSKDSHKTLPVVKSSGRLLWKRDIFPYRKLIARRVCHSIMTAHVFYPELDSELCATLSKPIITDLLRKRLKFRGIVVSDDLWMKAISERYEIPEAVCGFFRAGGDLAMICREPEIQIEAIEEAKKSAEKDKTLQNHFRQSIKRIQKVKKLFCSKSPPHPISVIGCSEHQNLIKKITG